MGRTAMSGLTKISKDKNVTKQTKRRLVNALVFAVAIMYGCVMDSEKGRKKERKKEREKFDSFEMWCWRLMLKIPWTVRRTN